MINRIYTYIEALKKFRGQNGAYYIYFFRYPPFINLGDKIKELSKVKDIYRINIHDEKLATQIEEIFYGYVPICSASSKYSLLFKMHS